jgi:hypothetical protein
MKIKWKVSSDFLKSGFFQELIYIVTKRTSVRDLQQLIQIPVGVSNVLWLSRANHTWLHAVYLHCTSVFATVCYHHHLGIVEFGHLLIRSGLTHPEISSVVSPGFFCPMVCSFLLFCVICYEAFCWHVAPSSVYSPKVGLHIIPCSLYISFIICPNVSCCSSRIFYHSSKLVFAVNEHCHYGIMPKL